MFVPNIARQAIKMSNIQIKIRPIADATKATKLKVRSFKGMFCLLRVSFMHSDVELRFKLKKRFIYISAESGVNSLATFLAQF